MTFDMPAIAATAFLLKSSSRSVWLYVRFPLSLRMVEDFLAVRGITVSHETVRRCLRDLLVSTRSQVASECVQLAGPVRNLELRLHIAGTQGLAVRVARQTRPPFDLPDRHPLTEMPAPDQAQ